MISMGDVIVESWNMEVPSSFFKRGHHVQMFLTSQFFRLADSIPLSFRTTNQPIILCIHLLPLTSSSSSIYCNLSHHSAVRWQRYETLNKSKKSKTEKTEWVDG